MAITRKIGFAIPENLSHRGRRAAEVILEVLPVDADGNCQRVFWSPKDWALRGEEYGLNSELVVVHDGGDHAAYFNYDYTSYACIDKMIDALDKIGMYPEQCTSWYSAIYKK